MPNGSTVSVAGWTQPVAEPEIAVYMASDLPGGASAGRGHRGGRRARPRDRACRSAGAAERRRGRARRQHLPSLRDPRAAGHVARGREARWPCRPRVPARRAGRAAGGPAGEHRQHRRYRGACRRHARGQRRKAAGRRRDHHRLDRPTAHDRAGRDRIRLSARRRWTGFRSDSAVNDETFRQIDPAAEGATVRATKNSGANDPLGG